MRLPQGNPRALLQSLFSDRHLLSSPYQRMTELTIRQRC